MRRALALRTAAAGLALILTAGTASLSSAVRPTPAPTLAPTPVPTPVPPPRVRDSGRKGAASGARVNRFPSQELAFSRLLRVEEIDLDRMIDARVARLMGETPDSRVYKARKKEARGPKARALSKSSLASQAARGPTRLSCAFCSSLSEL